jgi:hypothetical protein
MSRGRHSRPRARGGGLATLLALAVAGGAVAVAVVKPGPNAMRWCFVGLSAAVALGLFIVARTQRRTSRALARTEDRLRVLEQRNRDEGDELHRRVLESITREGELRFAVDVLSMEIARLRASLEGFVPGALAAPVLVEPLAPDTLDIPLVQRVLAAQEAAAPAPGEQLAPVAAELPAELPAEAVAEQPAEPVAVPVAVPVAEPSIQLPVSTWAAGAPPQAPVAEPAPVAAAAVFTPQPAPESRTESVTRSWVVRELQLDEEPGVALTMRILDLTTPPSPSAGSGEAEEQGAWPSFARPA